MACFEQALVALAHLPECRDTLEQAIDVRFDLRNALLPLGDEPRIFDHLHAAEALAERLNDLQRLGQITSYLCISFSALGEYDRAIAAGQRTLALATTSGAFDVQVAAETTLGQVYYTGGDFRQGLAVARRAMTLLTGEQHYARFGRVSLPAVSSRGYAAGCLTELGGFAEGRGVADEAIRIAEAVGQPFSLTGALTSAGLLARRQGAIPRAIPALERSLALCQSANFPRLFPWVAAILGVAYALAGRAPEAVSLLDQVLQHLATVSRVLFHALVLTELSEGLLLVGRVEEAGELAGRLLALSHTHPGRGYQAHASRLLGAMARRREPPDVDQATGSYGQALALAEELGMRPLQAHCHRGLGTLYATTGQREQARPRCRQRSRCTRDGDDFWLPETEAALAQMDRTMSCGRVSRTSS